MRKRQAYLTNTELEQRPGIKAQHAVYRALKELLTELDSGWDVEETAVGSTQDRNGVDIFLFSRTSGQRFLLDTSFRDKEDTVYLVLLKPWWFEEREDGSFQLRKECLRELVQAIKPALVQAAYA